MIHERYDKVSKNSYYLTKNKKKWSKIFFSIKFNSSTYLPLIHILQNFAILTQQAYCLTLTDFQNPFHSVLLMNFLYRSVSHTFDSKFEFHMEQFQHHFFVELRDNAWCKDSIQKSELLSQFQHWLATLLLETQMEEKLFRNLHELLLYCK